MFWIISQYWLLLMTQSEFDASFVGASKITMCDNICWPDTIFYEVFLSYSPYIYICNVFRMNNNRHLDLNSMSCLCNLYFKWPILYIYTPLRDNFCWPDTKLQFNFKVHYIDTYRPNISIQWKEINSNLYLMQFITSWQFQLTGP